MNFDYYDCLSPLLEQLGWKEDDRHFLEALPHLNERMDLIDLRNVMVNLGFTSNTSKSKGKLSSYHLPCLYIEKKTQRVFVVLERGEGEYKAIDCVLGGHEIVIPYGRLKQGTRVQFFPQPPEEFQRKKSWFFTLAQRFSHNIWPLMLLTLIVTLLGLMLPLFVSAIYDFVVPTYSRETLLYLVGGLALGLLSMHLLHLKKESLIAYIGARIDLIITTEIMRKLLYLPIQYGEGASVSGQIARLKQYDSLRDLFTGPFFQLATELPFLILQILVLAFIAGPVAFVPIVVLVIYAIVGVLIFPRQRDSTHAFSNAIQKRRIFLLEAIGNLKFIKLSTAESVWVNRFKEATTKVALLQKDNDELANYANNISQILIKAAGIVAIIWSAVRVMEGSMTAGSLMAVVLIVWRALNPAQTLFMFLGRADQFIETISQVNRLMQMPSEQKARGASLHLKGYVLVNNVTFRYGNDPLMALSGVSMEARIGETIAIIGANGSGKTTLLKLLLGFYPTQMGVISIDGVDTRQINPVLMRQAIAYAPHHSQFFHGTFAQNLLLAQPNATDKQIVKAFELSGIMEEIAKMPMGIHTRLTEIELSQFSLGFIQKVNLARTYVKDSKLLILDEPSSTLDAASDEHLKSVLTSFKGQKTVILVTHRPSLIQVADRVLALQNGLMRVFGPRDKVLDILAGKTQ